MRNLTVAAFFAALVLLPASASADFLQVYANGHGTYLSGDGNNLKYFDNPDNAGLGYGFTLGVEVVQIDAFVDANFFPDGSQWNQLGLGFDMDLIPGDIFVEPTAQLLYFFGKQSDGSDSVRGLFPRVGAQAGIDFLKVLYVGVEAYVGYVLSTPDFEHGVAYVGSAFLGARMGLF